MRRQADGEREALEELRRREQEERRKRREAEAAEAEAARAREVEEARRKKAEQEGRTPREAAMADQVAPRLAMVRQSQQPFTDSQFPASGTRLLPVSY